MKRLVLLLLVAACNGAPLVAPRMERFSAPLEAGAVQRQAFDTFAACLGSAPRVPFQEIIWRVVREDVPVDRFGRFEYEIQNEPRWLYGVYQGHAVMLARIAVNDLATNIHEIAHAEGYGHEDAPFLRCVPRMTAVVQ